MEYLQNFEERLVRFAGESYLFVQYFQKDNELKYFRNQLVRSSASSALNYGEAQGSITNKDFIFKTSLTVKELKESRTTLKILKYIDLGEPLKSAWLLKEVEELIAISSKMINNKR